MDKVIPRRNLGPAENWGRQIERAILAEQRKMPTDQHYAAGLGRSSIATLGELARQARMLEKDLAGVPHVFSKSAQSADFALPPPGWFTALSLDLVPPAGKTRLDVTVSGRGVARGEYTTTYTHPGASQGTDRFRWPFPPSTITGPLNDFGPRPPLPYHNGVDFMVGSGVPVTASGDGVVSYVQGWRGSTGGMDALGNYVRINHGTSGGRTLATGYAHMIAYPEVSSGQRVTRGQRIGATGNTGFSTAPHLHWETWVDGTRIDPKIWMATYGDSTTAAPPVTRTETRGSSAMWSRLLIGSVTSRQFSVIHGDGGSLLHAPVWGATLKGVKDAVRVSLQFQSSKATPKHPDNVAVLTAFGAFS